MVEIDRRVAALARRIDIDHLEIFADGSGLEVVLPADIERGLVDGERVQVARQRRIVGIDAQRAVCRRRHRRVLGRGRVAAARPHSPPTGGVTGTLTRAPPLTALKRLAQRPRRPGMRRQRLGQTPQVGWRSGRRIGRHDAFDRRVLRKLQRLEFEHLLLRAGARPACRGPSGCAGTGTRRVSASVLRSADAAAGVLASAAFARNSPRPRRLVSRGIMPRRCRTARCGSLRRASRPSDRHRPRRGSSAARSPPRPRPAASRPRFPGRRRSMTSLQPNRAHGTFGVGAAMAVSILLSGP